jgi:methylenetetrahydrofolate reductase (NADPH)
MKLKDALKKNKFVVTSEVQPPIDTDPDEFIDRLNLIRGRVDGFSLSEIEIEGVVGDTINTCNLLKRNKFDPIYQTTTRLKNRLQLQNDLIHAHQAGVENLLVFTEDYRLTGDSLQEMMFFHVDAGKLSSVLDHLKEGHTVEGDALPDKAEFMLGSGVDSSWGKNVPDLEMREMEEMTKIGTGYFLTTPVFDLDSFEKFTKNVNTFGVPVIAEVMIIRNATMGQFLNRHMRPGMVPDWVIKKLLRAPEKKKASIEIFNDIATGLKDLCQGIHIISIGGEQNLRHYMDAANLY